jgi:pilus assembly protein CpaB
VFRRRWKTSRSYFMVSLALSAAAGLLVRSHVSRVASEASAATPKAAVVVASRPIERGAALASSDLRLATIPTAYVPPGALTHVSNAAGRVVLADLAAGEVVTQTRLARVRAGPVASLIPRGLRAFAVPTSLPGGLIAPGDLVDVLATFSAGQPHTELVVGGVQVLLVLGPGRAGRSEPAARSGGLDLDTSAAGLSGSTTLILLVSPDQEERLAFARAFANLEVTMAPPA